MDWKRTIEANGVETHVPSPIVALGLATAAWRGKLSCSELDQDAPWPRPLSIPVLLVHGRADDKVPIEPSEAFAEHHRPWVTFVPFAGAGHMRAWNTDPAGYAAAVVHWWRTTARPLGEIRPAAP